MPTVYTNHHNIPNRIVAAVTRDEKFSLGRYSVTQLLAPPRIRRYLQEHTVEEDVSERVWALLGKGVHAVIDGGDHATQEIEISGSVDVDGRSVWVSGTIDDFRGGVLRDWKVTGTSTWRAGGRSEWIAQLNFYSWLLQRGRMRRSAQRSSLDAHIPVVPNGIAVTMIFRDWIGARAKAGAGAGAGVSGVATDYPAAPIATLDIPMWSVEAVEEMIVDRLRVHMAAEATDLADLSLCSDEERWHRPGEFAVMKAGRKRAMRVFSRREDAVAFAEHQGIGGLSIDARPGVDARCADYCPVRSVCPHGAAQQQIQQSVKQSNNNNNNETESSES